MFLLLPSLCCFQFTGMNCLSIHFCLGIPNSIKVKWPVMNATRKNLEKEN